MFHLLVAITLTAPAMAAAPVAEPMAVAVAPDTLARYDTIRAALVVDRLDAAQAGARDLAAATPAADGTLIAAATILASASSLPQARMAFGELSRLVILRASAADPAPRVWTYYCPMFAGFPWWIQAKPGLANPYMGQAMPGCGEERSLKLAAKAAQAPPTGAAP